MKKVKFFIISLFMLCVLHGYSQSKSYSDRKITIDINFNLLNSMAEKHSFILAAKEDFEIEAFLITDNAKFEKAKQSAFTTANCGKCELVESTKTDQPMDEVFNRIKEGEVFVIKFLPKSYLLERYANSTEK